MDPGVPPKASPRLAPKIGLAAVVLLAPGGFVLGAGLAWQWWRKRPPPAA